MANDIYYGIYMKHSDINEILKRPASHPVITLNITASARLRATAATMDIPETKLKQKLRFYILEDPEVAKLASDINATFYVMKYNSFSQPIISIKESDINSVFNRVNPYNPRYTDPIHRQYHDDLVATFKPHIVKL